METCIARANLLVTKDGVIDRFKMVKNQEGKSQNVSDLISVTRSYYQYFSVL
jgi:hypothetical protein